MSTKFFAIAGLLALTSALPASERALATRAEECWSTQPGTVYYKCGVYDGCFSKDPCGSSSPPTPPTTPSATPSATSSCVPSATPTALTSHNITKVQAYNLYTINDNTPMDPVPHMDIHKPANSPISTMSVLIFDNVPKGAQNCQLHWRSSVVNNPSVFLVQGNGLAYTRQLKEVPADPTKENYKTFPKYQDKDAAWGASMEFTGWADGPSSHVGPGLKCAEQIAVEIKGSDKGDDVNRVTLVNNESNGLYLTYSI